MPPTPCRTKICGKVARGVGAGGGKRFARGGIDYRGGVVLFFLIFFFFEGESALL